MLINKHLIELGLIIAKCVNRESSCWNLETSTAVLTYLIEPNTMMKEQTFPVTVTSR
jgi:hypothetical protein